MRGQERLHNLCGFKGYPPFQCEAEAWERTKRLILEDSLVPTHHRRCQPCLCLSLASIALERRVTYTDSLS